MQKQGNFDDLIPVKSTQENFIETKSGKHVALMEVTPGGFVLKSPAERNRIADSFHRMLKTAPPNLQIKVIQRGASLSSLMEKREKETVAETNERCMEMQVDFNNLLLRRCEESLIERKYYLCFSYGEDETANAVQDLRSAGSDISSRLEECKNIISPVPAGQLLSSLLPEEGIDFTDPDACAMDGRYCVRGVIPKNGYPSLASAGWISCITASGADIDVDIYLKKLPKEKVLSSLRASINRNKASLSDTSDTAQVFDNLEDSVASGYYIKHGLASGDEIWNMGVMVSVYGESKEDSLYRFEALRKALLCVDISLQKLKFMQMQAYISFLPVCNPDPDIMRLTGRNILTSDAASLYPFTITSLCDPDGIYLGTDLSSGAPAVVDIFDSSKYKNANIFISGISGAGKTFALSLIASRLRLKHIPVIIIAPEKEHEFERLCAGIGGKFISIGGGSPDRINILDIKRRDSEDVLSSVHENGETSLLAQKLQSLKTFFRLLIPDITFEERQLADEALIEAYKCRGITFDNDSLSAEKEMPVLEDMYEKIPDEKYARRLKNALKLLTSGSERCFNGRTNIDTDCDFIVIGLEKTDPDLLPAAMYAAMDFAWSKIKEDRTKKKCLLMDEWWRFGYNSAAASYSLEIAKTIRAYGGSLILATQQLSDIFGAENGKYGAGILGSCSTNIVMQQEHSEAERVKDILGLTKSAASKIPVLKRGEALLNTNGDSLMINFEASPSEFNLITTDRASLERMRAASD